MSVSSLSNQLVTFYSASSRDRYGKESYGAGETFKIRLEERTKTIKNPNGEVVTIDALAFFDGDITVSVDDKLTYGDINYKVVTIAKAITGRGSVNHSKVGLKKIV